MSGVLWHPSWLRTSCSSLTSWAAGGESFRILIARAATVGTASLPQAAHPSRSCSSRDQNDDTPTSISSSSCGATTTSADGAPQDVRRCSFSGRRGTFAYGLGDHSHRSASSRSPSPSPSPASFYSEAALREPSQGQAPGCDAQATWPARRRAPTTAGPVGAVLRHLEALAASVSPGVALALVRMRGLEGREGRSTRPLRSSSAPAPTFATLALWPATSSAGGPGPGLLRMARRLPTEPEPFEDEYDDDEWEDGEWVDLEAGDLEAGEDEALLRELGVFDDEEDEWEALEAGALDGEWEEEAEEGDGAGQAEEEAVPPPPSARPKKDWRA